MAGCYDYESAFKSNTPVQRYTVSKCKIHSQKIFTCGELLFVSQKKNSPKGENKGRNISTKKINDI